MGGLCSCCDEPEDAKNAEKHGGYTQLSEQAGGATANGVGSGASASRIPQDSYQAPTNIVQHVREPRRQKQLDANSMASSNGSGNRGDLSSAEQGNAGRRSGDAAQRQDASSAQNQRTGSADHRQTHAPPAVSPSDAEALRLETLVEGLADDLVDVTERAVDSQLEDPREDVARALVQAVHRSPAGRAGPGDSAAPPSVPGAAEQLEQLEVALRWGGTGGVRERQVAMDRDIRMREAHGRLVAAGVAAGGPAAGADGLDSELLVHFDD